MSREERGAHSQTEGSSATTDVAGDTLLASDDAASPREAAPTDDTQLQDDVTMHRPQAARAGLELSLASSDTVAPDEANLATMDTRRSESPRPATIPSLGLAPGLETSLARDDDGGRRPLVRHFGDRVEHERVRGMIQAAIFGGGAAAAPVKIGRFTVLDRLGQGGMGVVYAAYDDRLERKVAVKVLRSGAADPGEAARTRLLREAQAMARLAHPNIVSVHEVGDHDGQVFVAMEYVKGQSLDAWIQRAPPRPWREVIAVLRQAGRGLAAAHDAGIIHRDFKPHNALLGEDGVVKVLDFGLARASDRALAAPEDDRAAPPSGLLDASLTRTGAVMGTPAYMSPEQHTGIRVDARSDQFSFSVALYEALYGQLPFDCASLPALMTAVLDGAIRPPPPGVKVPGWVHAVVTRGLAVAPEDRFPSMGALLDALDRDPAARRRRWLVGVGLAGLVAASSVSLAALQTTRPCEGVARELDDVWSDARREAVTAGLLAGEELHAQDTSARAAAGLDAYAAAWLDARARACEAHADGRQSDALYDLRVTCLERRRTSLDATASILADADATAREQAATAVQHLPSLARCADVEALQATLAPPEDPTLVDDVARAGERLATGRAHEETGRYAQALAIADEVLASPAADAYEPLRAEATLARGRALLLARRPEEAEATLNDALWSALGVGQDELAAEALARRVYVRGELAREGARVLDDAPLGRALLRRSHAEPRLRWLFENNLAVAEDRAGHGALAQAGYERALAALGDAGGVEEAATRANLAMYLQERFQLHEATEQLERALSIASAALGPEHPQISQYQWALADNLARRGQFARPVALLQQTIARGHALLDPGSLAFHLDALAKLELERRAYEDAAAHASRALELITEAFGGDNPLRAEYLADLGEAEVGRGRVDDGLARYREGLALAMRVLAADDPAVARARTGLARGLVAAGRPDEARGELDQAVASLEAAGGAATRYELAEALRVRHRVHLARGDSSAALADLRRAASNLEAAVPEESPVLAPLLHELAEVERQLGDRDGALATQRRALAIFERARDPDDPALAGSRLALARTLGPGDRSARRLADEALAAYRSLGDAYAAEAAACRRLLAGA